MDYVGEHLLPGQLGHFFIVLSLVASLVATVSYGLATYSKDLLEANRWKRLARWAFFTEVVSVLAVFSILFYIIYNHLFFGNGSYKTIIVSLDVRNHWYK